MATGQEIIEDAYMDIGVGNPGDELDQSIINRGLRILNRMWGSWSAEVEPVYASTLDELTWTASSQSMTIGATGDLVTARPIEITGFQSRKSGQDYTLTQVSFEQYQTAVLKTATTDYPSVFAYNKTYPNGTLYIFPVSASNLTVRIQSIKPLTAFTLVGTVDLPDGYELAIQKGLSCLLGPAHGKSALVAQGTPIYQEAFNAKEVIERVNDNEMEMRPDPMIPGLRVFDDLDILT